MANDIPDRVKQFFTSRERIFVKPSDTTKVQEDLEVSGNLVVGGGIKLGKNELQFKDWKLKV